MNIPSWVIYPSLFKPEDTRLAQRFKQALDPRRAECYLYGIENEMLDRLVTAGIQDFGYKFDVDLDKGQQNIDLLMKNRVKAGDLVQPAYLLEGQTLDTPNSTDPAAFKTFDLEAFLEDGGDPIGELWIGPGDGPVFGPAIDATARNINGTGNPRCNPNMLTDWTSDQPGENGALVWCNAFRMRVEPGTDGADRYQCIFLPGGGNHAWGFILANPVEQEKERVTKSATETAAKSKKKGK